MRVGKKKIGTACDDWKLDAFVKEFKARGIITDDNSEISALPHKCKLISVYCDPDDFNELKEKIRRACIYLENKLKRSN